MVDDIDNISRLMENLDDLYKDLDGGHNEVIKEKENTAFQIINHLLDKKYLTPQAANDFIVKYRLHPLGFHI